MSRPESSAFVKGLLCRCPRCGQGKLFSGFLSLAKVCSSCDLDYSFADSGDGPAVFVIFLVAPLIMVFWYLAEAWFHPAPWMHLVLWIPTTLVLSLLLLRPFKGVLVALQYQNRAGESRHH
ncbi:DUF983 domain-containing protein [Devosia sp. A449]